MALGLPTKAWPHLAFKWRKALRLQILNSLIMHFNADFSGQFTWSKTGQPFPAALHRSDGWGWFYLRFLTLESLIHQKLTQINVLQDSKVDDCPLHGSSGTLTHGVNLVFYYYIIHLFLLDQHHWNFPDQSWHKIGAPASHLFTAQHATRKEMFYLSVTPKEQLLPKK